MASPMWQGLISGAQSGLDMLTRMKMAEAERKRQEKHDALIAGLEGGAGTDRSGGSTGTTGTWASPVSPLLKRILDEFLPEVPR